MRTQSAFCPNLTLDLFVKCEEVYLFFFCLFEEAMILMP